jgi:histidine ammonia-lyase
LLDARVAAAADLVVAATMEALRADPSIVDPAVAAAKPIRTGRCCGTCGGCCAAAHPRARRRESVQDPLSVESYPRSTAPCVSSAASHEAVEGELAAMDDARWSSSKGT